MIRDQNDNSGSSKATISLWKWADKYNTVWLDLFSLNEAIELGFHRCIIHKCTGLRVSRFFTQYNLAPAEITFARGERQDVSRQKYVRVGWQIHRGYNSRLVDPRIRRPCWLVHCQADPSSSSLSIRVLADDVRSVQIGRAIFGESMRTRRVFSPFDTRIYNLRPFSFLPSILMEVNRGTINLRLEVYRSR